jgi:hypothetical protein
MANENEENLVEGADAGDALGNLDFNVDDEFKAEPLLPKGTFHAVVTGVKFNPAQMCIVWDFCLHDNGGVMNDDETPIDGQHCWFRNWLPRPGDEGIMTKSGNKTKRQSKINMLKDFQDTLKIDMTTPVKIATALADGQWIGLEADVDVDVEEYQGRFRNSINKVRKSMMY